MQSGIRGIFLSTKCVIKASQPCAYRSRLWRGWVEMCQGDLGSNPGAEGTYQQSVAVWFSCKQHFFPSGPGPETHREASPVIYRRDNNRACARDFSGQLEMETEW